MQRVVALRQREGEQQSIGPSGQTGPTVPKAAALAGDSVSGGAPVPMRSASNYRRRQSTSSPVTTPVSPSPSPSSVETGDRIFSPNVAEGRPSRSRARRRLVPVGTAGPVGRRVVSPAALAAFAGADAPVRPLEPLVLEIRWRNRGGRPSKVVTLVVSEAVQRSTCLSVVSPCSAQVSGERGLHGPVAATPAAPVVSGEEAEAATLRLAPPHVRDHTRRRSSATDTCVSISL